MDPRYCGAIIRKKNDFLGFRSTAKLIQKPSQQLEDTEKWMIPSLTSENLILNEQTCSRQCLAEHVPFLVILYDNRTGFKGNTTKY